MKNKDKSLKTLWSKVNFQGPKCGRRGRCWETSVKSDQARKSYKLNVGDPGKLHVCHHCDNPKCVRPSHLFLGTNNDNRQDSVLKDRHARGERHGRAKLTDSQIEEIRNRYVRKSYHDSNAKQLAKEFGIHQEYLGLIIRNTYRKKKTNYVSKRHPTRR